MINEELKQLVLDYQDIFGTAAGKRVMDDMATRFNFRGSFSSIVQCGLPEHTALELGKREAYLYILDKIEADPNQEVQEVAEIPTEMENVYAGG